MMYTIILVCVILLLWLRYMSPVVVFYKHVSRSRFNLPRVQVGGHAVWTTSNDRIAPFTWKALPTGIIPYTLWIYPKVVVNFVEDQNVIVNGGLTKYHVGIDDVTGELILYLFNNKPYPVDLEDAQYIGSFEFYRQSSNLSINF